MIKKKLTTCFLDDHKVFQQYEIKVWVQLCYVEVRLGARCACH